MTRLEAQRLFIEAANGNVVEIEKILDKDPSMIFLVMPKRSI